MCPLPTKICISLGNGLELILLLDIQLIRPSRALPHLLRLIVGLLVVALEDVVLQLLQGHRDVVAQLVVLVALLVLAFGVVGRYRRRVPLLLLALAFLLRYHHLAAVAHAQFRVGVPLLARLGLLGGGRHDVLGVPGVVDVLDDVVGVSLLRVHLHVFLSLLVVLALLRAEQLQVS